MVRLNGWMASRQAGRLAGWQAGCCQLMARCLYWSVNAHRNAVRPSRSVPSRPVPLIATTWTIRLFKVKFSRLGVSWILFWLPNTRSGFVHFAGMLFFGAPLARPPRMCSCERGVRGDPLRKGGRHIRPSERSRAEAWEENRVYLVAYLD